MAKITSLILTIELSPSEKIVLTKDNKKQEVSIKGDTKYSLNVKQLRYYKQMYAPGEICAELQLEKAGTTWTKPDNTDVIEFFRGRKVTLQYGDIEEVNKSWTISNAKDVCENYYIWEVKPRYMPNAAYVTLKIFSIDKLMTLSQACKSWTAKRLARDIIAAEVPAYLLLFDGKSTIDVDYSHLQNLKRADCGDEIHPYLVQYNESFYDFLVRTCNRWGEFMFYENKKLNFGYDDASKVHDITTFDSLTYCNINEQNNSYIADNTHYGDDVTHSIDVLNTPLTKDKYDMVKNALGCSLKDGGDLWTAKIFGNLFSSGKNLYDFIVDTVVDEGIALGQIKTRVNNNNKKFANDYFDISSSLSEEEKKLVKSHHGTDKDGNETFNQFSSAKPVITSDKYKTILANEIEAANDAICISFDTTYQDVKLGDIITIQGGDEKYIVVKAFSQTESSQTIDSKLDKDNKIINEVKTTEKTTYHIVATAQVEGQFYPTVHPAGHVRKSGPQLAVVKKPSLEDPLKLLRVRVQFPWQSGDDITPWLSVARPGGNKGCGSYNRHYVDEQVIVAFADDNLERPYVMCSLSVQKQTPPASAHLNDIVHVSPGGQSVKISDGTGSGFTQFMSGFNPGLKLIKGFFPGSVLPILDFESSKSFEGGIELADKFGMYSIKGSTDGRNVSIKSPYGDVKINAFTGITISAPNGDVKIAGKNVTIEAGNNLTLTSGKNVKDGFWLSYQDKDLSKAANWGMTIAGAVAKKLEAEVGGFVDMTILRSALEVFMRPIEGKLTVKSNRYLALEAGSGKTGYPVDAYWKAGYGGKWGISSWRARSGQKDQAAQDNMIRGQFENVDAAVMDIVFAFCQHYTQCQHMVENLKKHINKATKRENPENPVVPCDLDAIIKKLWSNPDDVINNNFIGFKGMLQDANTEEELTEEMIRFFQTGYNANDPQKVKDAKRLAAFKRHQGLRIGIKSQIEHLKAEIKALKEFKHSDYLDLFDDNTAHDALANDSVVNGSMLKTLLNEDEFKNFTKSLDEFSVERRKLEKQLRRKFFIILIDAYHFQRTKTGGIKGVGASVPSAPDPFADNIEADWATYVNSIQVMPKLKPDKSKLMDFAQNNFLDALIKQNGLLDAVNDARDNYAFGQGSKGRILFSSGGDTMILGEDIMRANTDNAEDTDLNNGTEGFVSKIRRQMMG